MKNYKNSLYKNLYKKWQYKNDEKLSIMPRLLRNHALGQNQNWRLDLSVDEGNWEEDNEKIKRFLLFWLGHIVSPTVQKDEII